MSNVKDDRHVEGDWWADPIPPNVEFGEGFYCESAQIFRRLQSTKSGAVIIRTSPRTVFQKSAQASQIEDRPCENRKQRLDRHECGDFERRHHRGKLSSSGGVGRYKKRGTEHGRRRKPSGCRETVWEMIVFNVQRS